MKLFGNQRWRDGVASYRRPDEQCRVTDFDVAAISDEIACSFVTQHHYEHSYPSSRFPFGLFEKGELVGVAVFSHPLRQEVLTRVFGPGTARITTDLGRFVLLDHCKGNSETVFLKGCFDALARDYEIEGVVSFSDPFPRTDISGKVTMPGHVGTIYQAHNARYLGQGRRESIFLLPDGTTLARRAMSKLLGSPRARQNGGTGKDRGWRYVAKILVRHGADRPACLDSKIADFDELNAFWKTWAPRLLRSQIADGKHKYGWALGRKRLKKMLPSLNPAIYPKKHAS